MPESTAVNTNRWISLGIMQRADQLRMAAELLAATMGDLMEQMEQIESCVEETNEGIETIQNCMDDLVFMMEDYVESKPCQTTESSTDSTESDLPWS